MHIVIFVTCANKKEAKDIAARLVSLKLAACVNILDGVRSLFRWKGKVDTARETLMVVKSNKKKFKQIVKLVKSMHSYEVPEIIALPIVDGESNYLRWIDESVR